MYTKLHKEYAMNKRMFEIPARAKNSIISETLIHRMEK